MKNIYWSAQFWYRILSSRYVVYWFKLWKSCYSFLTTRLHLFSEINRLLQSISDSQLVPCHWTGKDVCPLFWPTYPPPPPPALPWLFRPELAFTLIFNLVKRHGGLTVAQCKWLVFINIGTSHKQIEKWDVKVKKWAICLANLLNQLSSSRNSLMDYDKPLLS